MCNSFFLFSFRFSSTCRIQILNVSNVDANARRRYAFLLGRYIEIPSCIWMHKVQKDLDKACTTMELDDKPSDYVEY